MMLTNLADILRGAGLRVVETPGWRTRGHGQMSGVRGVLWHHTATSARAGGDYPSQNIVTHGRSDLPGPLCNVGLGRTGTWYCIAAGLAWHAGSGSYPGIGSNGNAWLIGVEAEHPGTSGHPWPAAQVDAYRRGTAALLRAYGLGADRCIGHKEWAPRRKIDPHGLDMNAERRFVAGHMTGRPAPAAAPPPPGGIETMGFNDGFKDWAGHDQTVLSWMNDISRKVNDLHFPAVAPGSVQSRIPGDKNVTNVFDMIKDNTSWTNQILGRVIALQAAGQADPAAVANALRPVVAEVVGPVIQESVTAALGQDNAEQAAAIVDQISQRLGQPTTEGA